MINTTGLAMELMLDWTGWDAGRRYEALKNSLIGRILSSHAPCFTLPLILSLAVKDMEAHRRDHLYPRDRRPRASWLSNPYLYLYIQARLGGVSLQLG